MCPVTDASEQPPRALPPGQRLAKDFPVLHYGPVPRFRPDSWRLVVNGYLPDYLYENGALTTRVALAELKRLAHIGERAKAADRSPDFSARIRDGVPTP